MARCTENKSIGPLELEEYRKNKHPIQNTLASDVKAKIGAEHSDTNEIGIGNELSAQRTTGSLSLASISIAASCFNQNFADSD